MCTQAYESRHNIKCIRNLQTTRMRNTTKVEALIESCRSEGKWQKVIELTDELKTGSPSNGNLFKVFFSLTFFLFGIFTFQNVWLNFLLVKLDQRAIQRIIHLLKLTSAKRKMVYKTLGDILVQLLEKMDKKLVLHWMLTYYWPNCATRVVNMKKVWKIL